MKKEMTTESNLCVLRNKRKGVVDVSWLSAQVVMRSRERTMDCFLTDFLLSCLLSCVAHTEVASCRPTIDSQTREHKSPPFLLLAPYPIKDFFFLTPVQQ